MARGIVEGSARYHSEPHPEEEEAVTNEEILEARNQQLRLKAFLDSDIGEQVKQAAPNYGVKHNLLKVWFALGNVLKSTIVVGIELTIRVSIIVWLLRWMEVID